MALIFWGSIAAIVYVYVGYPLVLRAWARLAERPLRIDPETDAVPGVSIVIAAFNEADRLGARLDNLLALDYPADRRQIIVVSDGSTDGTLDVLRGYRPHVESVDAAHGGKAAALNTARALARFEIVVFADARQAFAPDALRQLVTPFGDASVGGVTGELLLDCESALFSNRRQGDRRRPLAALPAAGRDRRSRTDRRSGPSTIGDGVGAYWRYEKELRRLESAVGSTLGATGAIYAVRRALWEPLPAETILDDVLIPMRIVLAGFRVVFAEKARAFDRAAVDAEAESRRKIRTLAGNYQILRLEPALLLPWRNPVWIQYVSHKLGRLIVPYALLTLFAASVALAAENVFALVALIAQVMFYLLAGYGALIESSSRRPPAAAAAAPVPASVQAKGIA